MDGELRGPGVRGITLVESLVALLILAFGVLALVRWQLALSLQGDAARQRSEATQLARSKLEQLRAFERIAPAAGVLSYAAIESGADSPPQESNTTYRRAWSVSGSGSDGVRQIDVTVDWADRTGAAQQLRLHSALSRTDPALVGALGLPPFGNDPFWRPSGRHRAVPSDAFSVRADDAVRSALPWLDGRFVVFDAAGTAVALCSSTPSDSTSLATDCVAIVAYLLQGYLHGVDATMPVQIAFDRLQHLQPLTAPSCKVEQAFDARGNPLADTRRYRCLVQPTDHDADASTPRVWSGRVLVVAPEVLVCRYTTSPTATRNVDHPETYTRVDGPLDHQNFVLLRSGECPSGTVAHPSPATLS